VKACPICGETFDVHTPFGATDAAAQPDAGSLLLCGGCGQLYEVGAGLELERRELGALELPPAARNELAAAQAFFRERAARQPPPGYVAAIELAEKRIRGWLDRNRKGEPPRLRMAPDSILVVAELARLRGRIAGNGRARELLDYLARVQPDLTVFMLRVAAVRLGLSIESVSLGELGLDTGGLS
jgi:hypothetical protein